MLEYITFFTPLTPKPSQYSFEAGNCYKECEDILEGTMPSSSIESCQTCVVKTRAGRLGPGWTSCFLAIVRLYLKPHCYKYSFPFYKYHRLNPGRYLSSLRHSGLYYGLKKTHRNRLVKKSSSWVEEIRVGGRRTSSLWFFPPRRHPP